MTRKTLIKQFTVHLLDELSTARSESRNPEHVVKVNSDEIESAIDCLRDYSRVTTQKEFWILHRYMHYLERRLTK